MNNEVKTYLGIGTINYSLSTIHARVYVSSHRTRNKKRFVLDTRIYLVFEDETRTHEVCFDRTILSELIKFVTLLEHQEKVDKGVVYETDLQISG